MTTTTSRLASGNTTWRYFWDALDCELWRATPTRAEFCRGGLWEPSRSVDLDSLIRSWTETPDQRVCDVCDAPVVAVSATRYIHGAPNSGALEDQSPWDHPAQVQLVHAMDADPFAGLDTDEHGDTIPIAAPAQQAADARTTDYTTGYQDAARNLTRSTNRGH